MKIYPLKKVEIDGKRTTFIEAGKSNSGTTLLMLPGWPISAISLNPLIQALEKEFRCIALNLPGYGGSKTNSRIFHSFDYYSNFLLRFQDRILKEDKINFFGHSTGGVHGLNFAMNNPERIKHLIIFSSPFNGVDHMKNNVKENLRTIKLINTIRRHPNLLHFFHLFYPQLIKKIIVKWLLRTVYMKRYPDINKMDDKFMSALLKDTYKFNTKVILDIALDITHREYDKLAKSIKTETLVIAGERDHAVDPQESKRLANLLPRGKYAEITNCGHDVVITKPELIASHILDFIKT